MNPTDLTKVIDLLRQTEGNDELLENYRGMMRDYFVLSEQQWIDWIEDIEKQEEPD